MVNGRRLSSVLVEYRVHQLEKQYVTMMDRVDGLATSKQLRDLENKLDRDAAKKAERWYNTWVIALASPIACGVVIALILSAIFHGAVYPHPQ